MSKQEKVLLIDAGNSYLKVSLMVNGVLQPTERFSDNDEELFLLNTRFLNIPKVLSSVLDNERSQHIAHILSPCLVLSTQLPLPIEQEYESPETLGIDRLCNACAIHQFKKTIAAISIDIGTCIKFDVVEENRYVGGSISPGIELRYRSMHEFTGKLPLLDKRDKTDLIGKNSHQSMHSGVINGIQKELEGFITEYRNRYADLTFFITGGDAVYFDFEGKSDIFAVENLTLEGMYTIYSFNAK
jgi:type III pantothenate kinase